MLGDIGPCEEHDARGPAAEPVDGRRILTESATKTGKECVLEVAASRQYREAGGFRDRQDVFVAIKDRKAGWRIGLGPGLSMVGKCLTRREDFIGCGSLAFEQYLAGHYSGVPGLS